MMRQSSSRNQRCKGVYRLRHFFQICLWLAICIWLVYQVKHSHDKKRAFVETKEVEEHPYSFQFGRKDLPTVKENELISETIDMVEDEVEGQEDQVQKHEMMMEDDQDEEGKGDVDVWIDEQDQDQQGEKSEQEVEFKNEKENGVFIGNADSVDSLEHEDSVLDAEENKKINNVSRSVAHETHMTEAEARHSDARGLDDEKPDDIDVNLKKSASDVAVDVSNKIYIISQNGDLKGFMSNLNRIGSGENTTLPEAANQSLSWTSSDKSESVFRVFKHENGSISSPIPAEENNPTELQTNLTTAAFPLVTAISIANVSKSYMETANQSTVAFSQPYEKIQGNEIASLIPVRQKHTILNSTSGEDHSKVVGLEDKFEYNPIPKSSEEQYSEDLFANTLFSKIDFNLSHNAVTEEEREARTDLSTLPEIQNDMRHDYDETEE